MGLSDGTHVGTLIKYQMTKSKQDRMQISLRFGIRDDDNSKHELTYYGSFEGKARKFTIQALLNCGLKSFDDTYMLFEGKGLQLGIKCRLVLAWEDVNGKSVLKIKWVNRQGGFGEVFDKNRGKAELKGMKGDFSAIIKEEGTIKQSNEDDEAGF